MVRIVAKYASIRAPRYTSYPTAPHFRAGFDEAVYRDWLARLNPDAPLSLYLHVPFCRKICWYCGCNMKLAARYKPLAEYVETLLAEAALLASALPARMKISHIHWGGGTPTALRAADMARVMDALRARCDVAPNAEIALEIDPRTLEPNAPTALGAMGFNRASFGVQEFDPKVQAAINRDQPFEMVARVTEDLRVAGVSNVNFDLMYGLPHQTVEMLLATVERAVSLRPDRIALFGYAHVPWMAKNQRMLPVEALPDPQARMDQSDAAAARLVALGYVRIGLDHFALSHDAMAEAARQGTLRRNFQGYTTDAAAALIGMGATAIGATPSGYVQNIAETGAYARAVAAGRLPVAKGLPITRDDILRRAVIERLMCDLSVDLAGQARAHGESPDYFAPEISRLREMEADGLVQITAGRVRITQAGRPVMRAVAAVFDAYLSKNPTSARHSTTI